MKSLSFLIGLSLLGLTALNSCKTVEPKDLVVAEVDLCNQKATVLESSCGALYLKTSKGEKIFAAKGLDASLQAGDQVFVGFYQFPIEAADSDEDPNDEECGGCYNGEDGQNKHGLELDAEQVCMQEIGISAASILCIKLDEGTDKGSKSD